MYGAVIAMKAATGRSPSTPTTRGPSRSGRCRRAHRVLVHYLPAPAGILDPAYASPLAEIPDGQAKRDGVATGEHVAASLIELRADDGFREPVTYRRRTRRSPACGARPRPPPPIGPYLGLMRTVQPRVGRPIPAGRAARMRGEQVGTGLQRGEGHRIEHEHDADCRADPGRPVLGRGPGAAGPRLVPQVRARPRARRRRMHHGSSRCGPSCMPTP